MDTWKLDVEKGSLWIWEDNQVVAMTTRTDHDQVKRFQKMAAAPDLLEALKKLYNACMAADEDGELDSRINGEMLDNANDALQKAEASNGA
jgi:hypothetical protein